MYNSIQPINIVYRKQQGTQNQRQQGVEVNADERGQNSGRSQEVPNALEQGRRAQQDGREFPNGAKVAIDYSKNKINISQVLTDFRSTVLAINAPKDISDEVFAYLTLVEKESLKQKPSREIVLSNLKNASRVSDAYIAKTLNKPSKVVEGWVDALFLQDIILKADPAQINPDFRVNLPEQVEQTTIAQLEQIEPQQQVKTEQLEQLAETASPVEITEQEFVAPIAPIKVENMQQPSENNTQQLISDKLVTQEYPPAYDEFMKVFSVGKKLSRSNNPKEALVAFSKSIEVAQNVGNVDFKGAAHLERGKIFDRYDHIKYALGEYNEATKCDNNDIKTHAHIRMAKIYDDYAKFEPAVEHYHSAVSFSGNNPSGQSHALKGLGKMYTDRFDKTNAVTFNNLAIEVAQSANKPDTVGKIYQEVAQDYTYLGENKKALDCLKRSTAVFAGLDDKIETNAQIAQNYFEASKLMKSLGNEAKAKSLLLKAYQYQSIA